MHKGKTGSLARNAQIFSAFAKTFGKTLISGLALTTAERQIAELPAGRMRLWAQGVNLYFDEAIMMGLDDLVAEIQVTDPNSPLVPERTDQYSFRILKGRIRLDREALTALLNRYVFCDGSLPLADTALELDERGMRLTGTLSWGPLSVPLLLAGPLSLGENGSVCFEVARVEAGGWGLNPLLSLLRTDIEKAFHLPAGGPVVAKGNTLELDPEGIITSPQTLGRPSGLQVERDALVLLYETAEPLPAPPLVDHGASVFLFSLGHALLVGKIFLDDAVFQVVPRSCEATRLDFSLQQYRRQLATGESTLKQHGELIVRLPNLTELEAESYAKLNARIRARPHRRPAWARQPD